MASSQAPAGTASDVLLLEARRAAERGWLLTPLVGKRPILREWQKAPAPEPAEVRQWASEGNLAVRTGALSGVIVIDDDTPDQSAATALALPQTVTAQTGGGGRHYYFKSPDKPVRNSASRLAPGIDVRGDKGLAVLPGSIHPETGAAYAWLPGHSPEDLPVAELPVHLLERIFPAKKLGAPACANGRQPERGGNRYAAAALQSAVDAIRSAEEGRRNDTLNRESFGIGQLVGAGRLGRTEAAERLSAAAQACGLPDRESSPTIESGLNAGIDNPRRDPDERDWQPAIGQIKPDQLRDVECRPGPRKCVAVLPGELHKAVDETMAGLKPSRNYGLFQRATQLVRVVRTMTPSSANGVRRDGGALMIYPVTAPYLVDRLTRAFDWLRPGKDELVPSDCPAKVVKSLLARVGEWEFDPLVGILEAPMMREDGSLLSENGYDEQSRLYLDLNGLVVPTIPQEPTIDQARAALDLIIDVIKDFPFVEACDRAAALAAIFTALARKSLRTAPMFVFRAPKMASGKSLLADVVAMVSTGRVAASMSQGRDEDEIRKRIFAVLLEGESVACIDNVDRPLGSDTLCSVLTQEVWKDRLLGKSETVAVSTKSTWLATGNNLTIVGDLTTRVVPCDLDSKLERPEEREFDRNLYAYVPMHRGELIAAALTVMRGYVVAGSPSQGLPVFGRFEQWSGVVRDPLVWLGMDDPCEGRRRLEVTDPIRHQLVGILTQWWKEFGGKSVTVAEVIQRATPVEQAPPLPLFDVLMEVAATGGSRLDGRKLGAWLSKHAGRREGGYHIERLGKRSGVQLWRVNRDQ